MTTHKEEWDRAESWFMNTLRTQVGKEGLRIITDMCMIEHIPSLADAILHNPVLAETIQRLALLCLQELAHRHERRSDYGNTNFN